MLARLYISNYALISSLDIEFPDGLVIITGETGAGKSILLGALSLLLGKRADASVLSDSTRNCVVEAEFSDKAGDNHILRRIITPAGRSRAFVDDEPVTLSDLAALSGKLVDIHEQHQHLLLTDPDYRLSVIDHFAGTASILEEYCNAYSDYAKLQESISSLEKDIASAARDAEYRRFQLDKLKEARLEQGEMVELEEEQKTLAHAEEIRTGLEAAYGLLNGEDMSVVRQLKDAEARLEKYAAYDSRLQPLAERLESARIELSDIESEIGRISSDITVSPQRLEEVEERMSLIYSLQRKYGCANEDELIALRNSLESSLDGAQEMEEKLSGMREELAALDKKRRGLAELLSSKRKQASESLSGELQEKIRSLEMPYAVFRAEVSPRESLGPKGADNLDFMFSANGESSLRDISKVASGGELSRVMLALKGLLARYTSMPTMIFDEIDTGVSGRMADRMGDMIGRMGHDMQIFAITHLPQIASKKGTHYLVYKEFTESGAHTGIRKLEGRERVMEVARMLSGSELTPEAMENARVLLEKAGNE